MKKIILLFNILVINTFNKSICANLELQNSAKQELHHKHKKTLKKDVLNAVDVIKKYPLSKAVDILHHPKHGFNKSSHQYVFVYNEEGDAIAHGVPHYRKTNRADQPGVKATLAVKDEGFITYPHETCDDDLKTAYVKTVIKDGKKLFVGAGHCHKK